MNQFKEVLTKVFDTLGFLNDQQKLSLTNLAVIVFLTITAVRGLFGGAVLTFTHLIWKIDPIDFASTLPLLFALLNYSSKRMTLSQNNKETPNE